MSITLRTNQRLTKRKWESVVDAVTADKKTAKRIGKLSRCKELRPRDANELGLKAAYVILNSGMKHEIATSLWPGIREALLSGDSIPFGHDGKVGAMRFIWQDRERLFAEYRRIRSTDEVVVEWCGKLPWIGSTTKFHLAMNCGADVCKPDVHLTRLAQHQGETVNALCGRLAGYGGGFSTGRTRIAVDRVSVVDRILWFALKDGVLKLER